MNAVVIRMKLLQPLLVTRPGAGEENSSEAYSFIPGGVLRGAFIGRYLARHPEDVDISRSKKDKGRTFFDGSCCFLNGYPLDYSGRRMLPTPLSWRMEKNPVIKYSTVYDFAINESGPKDPAGVKPEFASRVKKDRIELRTPERIMQIHNASLDRGTKVKGRSFVYRYEAIAEGQEFEAIILGDGARQLVNDLEIVTGTELRLGGSRSANYGRVKITEVKVVDDWVETPNYDDSRDWVIITLLSDAILTRSDGQPAGNLDELNLGKCIRAYSRTRLVGGFNRKWGLPLPQAEALQAGSVFVYQAGPDIQDRLEEFVLHGIGERRVEGFGRVAVNWQGEARYSQISPSSILAAKPEETRQPQPVLAQKASQNLAARMSERQMRAELEARLAKVLSQLSIEKPPQSSQLSRLREAARLALQKNDLALIPAHVSSLKSAADQLERARVVDLFEKDPPVRLNEWLTKHICTPADGSDASWTVWSKYLKPAKKPMVAGIQTSDDIMDKLQVEYTTRLLDAMFRHTTRKIQDKRGGGHDSTVE